MSHLFRLVLLLFLLQLRLVVENSTFAQIPTENLKLWLKANNVELVNEMVSQWYDASGNNLHLTQSNEANRPLQTSNIYAGYPAIRFDGINDQLKVNFSELTNQPVTFFVVWKKNASKQQNIFDGVDESNRMTFGQSYSNLENFAINASGTGLGLYYTKPVTSNLTVSSIIFSSPSKFFDNGVLKKSGNAGTMGINGLTVGAAYNNSRFFNGDITEIIVYNAELTDAQRQQVEQYLMDKYAPPVSFGEDITVNYGFCSQTLSIANGFTNIQWSNGDTTQTIEVSKTGEYWVSATDIFGRTTSDTINVTFTTGNPKVFSQNTTLCPDSLYIFHTGEFNSLNHYTVKWFNDFEGDTLQISNHEGEVWATITDSSLCTMQTDTISIVIDLFNQIFTLGNDTTFCSGNSISLLDNPLFDQINEFVWSNGSTNSSIVITATGNYWVEVKNNNGCLSRDTIYVTVSGVAPTVDFDFSGVCKNTPVNFTNNSTADPLDPITDVLWDFNDGDSSILHNPQHIFQNAGTYNIRLYVYSQSGCNNNIIKPITIHDLPKAFFQVDTACVANQYFFFDSSTPQPETTIETWHWDFGNGETSTEINPTEIFSQIAQHNLSLTVTDNFGCQGTYDTTITVVGQMADPNPFTLIWPPNNYASEQNTFAFSWNKSQGAQLYSFEISTDISFQDTVYQSLLTDSKIDYTLSDGSYYWRILARNYCGDEISSNIHFIQSGFISSQNGLSAAFSSSKQVEHDEENLVSSWGDITGAGFTATQTDNKAKPKLEANILNGKPALRFAHNDSASFLSFNNINLSNHDYTIFTVIKPENFNLPVHYFVSGGTTTESGLFAGGELIKGIGSFDGVNSMQTNTNSSQWQIAVFQNDKIIINGTEAQYGAYSIMSGLQLNTLGTRSSAIETQYFNGYLADLIVFNRKLTTDEIISVQDYLRFQYFPPVNLGSDTALACGSCNYTLSVPDYYSTYQWSNGATTPTIDINQTGNYWVKVTDIFGFTSTDTIFIKCPTKSCYPPVDLGSDIDIACGICEAEISAFAPHFVSYIWSNGQTSSTITATETGYYYVTATDTDGYLSVDSVFIQCPSVSCDPPVDLGPDINIDYGFCPVTLNAGDVYIDYKWSTGDTTQTIAVSQTGYYHVTVTDQYNYISTDSVKVTFPAIMLSDTAICVGETITLNTGLGGDYQYFWSNTSMSETITVSQQQEVWVLVTDSSGCEHTSPTVTIMVDSTSLTPVFTDDSVSLCSGNSIVANLPDTWNYQYSWCTGAQTHFIDVLNSGKYYVTVTSSNQCSVTDSIDVNVVGIAPVVDIAAENICHNDTLLITNNSYSPDSSAITLNWRLSDGQSFSGDNPEFIPTTAGTNTLILELESESGCQNTDSINFEVYPLPDFEIWSPDIVCNGQVVQFEAVTGQTNIAEWLWDFGNGVTDSTQNPQHIYDSPGTYQIIVNAVTEFGCSNTETKDITVH
ncbi:MAG TPA: PKD domain-containing protein, partial [Salinivirgaceae bacterium]|nr:PKD domain-containing protein [Salinivirgaceae bacterium]